MRSEALSDSLAPQKRSNHEYRPDIDGLRALAVLSVVGFHAFPTLVPGGFVGVDVFFVISGYIITRLLHAEWRSDGAIDIVAFYARRVRRIFPMLILVITVTLAASAFMLDDAQEIKEVARSAAASLVFAANWYFQQNTGGYFDPLTDRLPLLHLWSLGVEEQFYLVWPIALVLILRRRAASLSKALALAAGLSLTLAAILSIVDPDAAFYLMPARFWELAIGGLIALGMPKPTIHAKGRAAAGAALVLLAISLPSQNMQAAGVVPAVLGATLLLQAIHAKADLGVVGAALRSKPAVFFGLISYSLYLWHWPLLALTRAVTPGGTPAWLRMSICLASVVLAWASLRFVESPLRRPNPRTRDRRLVFAGVLATTALAYFSVEVAGQIPPPSEPSNPLIAATSNDFPSNRIRCHYKGDDRLDDFPRAGCTRNAAGARQGRVVIWGDSRAYAWQPLAWMLAERDGVRATNFTRDSCRPALGFEDNPRPLDASKCREFNALVVGHLEADDTLILAAAWPRDPQRGSFEERLAETLSKISPRVKRVIVLGPTPWLRDAVPNCIALDALDRCAISRAEFDAQAGAISRALAASAARFKNVEYVSLDHFFCEPSVCPAMKDGYGLYWDAHHISSKAASAFARQYLSLERQAIRAQ